MVMFFTSKNYAGREKVDAIWGRILKIGAVVKVLVFPGMKNNVTFKRKEYFKRFHKSENVEVYVLLQEKID